MSPITPPPRPWLLILFVWPAAAFVVVAIGWFALMSYFDMRERTALQDATRNTQNLVVALEEQTKASIDGLDQIMRFAVTEYRRSSPTENLRDWARDFSFLHEIAPLIAVVDSEGRFVATTDQVNNPQLDISDREHFRVQVQDPSVGLFISRSVIGKLSHEPRVELSRRLETEDGRFAGIVSVPLDASYISDFFSRVALGSGGVVALAGTDGVIKVRTGVANNPSSLNRPLPCLLQALQEAPAGTYENGGDTGGIDRIYSYRKVGGLPLVVVIAQPKAQILASVERDRRSAIRWLLGVTVVIAMLIALILRELYRRRKSDDKLAAHQLDLERLNGELSASKGHLQTTLDHMPTGILMIDANDAVPVINPRALELLELPAGLIDGALSYSMIRDAQTRTQEFEDGDPESLRLMSLGGLLDQDCTFELTSRRGRLIKVRNVALPGGGVVHTYTDITERRATDLELRAAKEQAEAANRARTAFLATMSHEIRTPLNGVIALADLLTYTGLDSEQRTYVSTLQKSADHLLHTINDILDFAKLDTEHVELEATAFDTVDLLQGVVGMLDARAAAKDLALDLVVDPDVPRELMGDPARLRQVLINLAGNAVKFTPTGSVRIDLSLDRLEAGRATVCFSVIDSGIGIPEAALQDLFQEFHQLDGSISRRYGGTGLGLAISRRLVRLMGGDIAVESAPDMGSRFHFTLDFAVVQEEAADRPAGLRARAEATLSIEGILKDRTVLLAEDNPVNQMVATAMLRKAGCTVDVAVTGREAVAAVGRRTYDLIFIDMMMPEMSGLEAARAIRLLPGAATVPILALTANAFTQDRDACLAAGMNGFVTKPFDSVKLVSAARTLIGEADAPPPCLDPEPADIDERPEGGAPDIDAATLSTLKSVYGVHTDRFLALFLSESARLLARTGERLAAGDLSALSIDAHTLKGSALTFGCRKVARLADELSHAAARSDSLQATESHGEVTSAFTTVQDTLPAYFRQAA